MNMTRETGSPSDGGNIILIGMPGVGKSTVGVVLAKHLGYTFVDCDLLIQEQEGKLLHEIIDGQGLDGFRRVENQVNASICVTRAVVATGGSAVYGEQAMAHLREIGTVVYLLLPCEELAERLGDLSERGVAIREGQSLEELFEERAPLYERYADVVIDCRKKQIRQIVKEIAEEFTQMRGTPGRGRNAGDGGKHEASGEKVKGMGHRKLERNLMDLIKEEQAKLGYRKESLRLYYPLGTLNHFYGSSDGEEEMQLRLEEFVHTAQPKLGAVRISHRGDRFCFEIPEQGSEYVHLNMRENEFIVRLVELVGKAGTTMGQVQALFEEQGTPVTITPMDGGEFDVMLRFTAGEDPYYYCFKDEGCHITYHRFLPEDYAEFGF